MLAASVFGLLANIALELAVRGIVRAAGQPPDDKEKDEDKEMNKTILRNVADGVSSMMDFLLPGSGRVADGFANILSGKQPREMSIFGGLIASVNAGFRKILNPYDRNDDFDAGKFWDGIYNLLEATASIFGGPVGGPSVAIRIGKAQLSEPKPTTKDAVEERTPAELQRKAMRERMKRVYPAPARRGPGPNR